MSKNNVDDYLKKIKSISDNDFVSPEIQIDNHIGRIKKKIEENEMIKQYRYFVSYVHRTGFGNCFVVTNKKIETIEDTRRIGKNIENENETNICIMFFTLCE